MADVRAVECRILVMASQKAGVVVTIEQAITLHMRAHAGTCQSHRNSQKRANAAVEQALILHMCTHAGTCQSASAHKSALLGKLVSAV